MFYLLYSKLKNLNNSIRKSLLLQTNYLNFAVNYNIKINSFKKIYVHNNSFKSHFFYNFFKLYFSTIFYVDSYKNFANKNVFLNKSFIYNSFSRNQFYFYKNFNNFYKNKKIKPLKKKTFFFTDNFFIDLKFKIFNHKIKKFKSKDLIFYNNNIISNENINIIFFGQTYKNMFLSGFVSVFSDVKNFNFAFVDSKKLINFWLKNFKKYFFKRKQVNFNFNILNVLKILKKNKKIINSKPFSFLIFKNEFNFFKFNFFKFNFFKFSLSPKNSYKLNFNKKTKLGKIYFKKKQTYLKKKIKINFKQTLLTFVAINDFFMQNKFSRHKFNINLFSNIHFLNNMHLNELTRNSLFLLKNGNKFLDDKKLSSYYNNYYPIFFIRENGKKLFFSKFKSSFDIDFINYIQFSTLNYLEHFFKKNIFLKVSNNFFKKYQKDVHLKKIFEDYRYYQPKYMKSYLISDFLELLWYSFLLKDLTFISTWISKLMEIMIFKNHKKFLTFFQNLVKKYSNVFIDILKIKGFFFDIRGKVGVTGSSKKRHIFFKIGNLGKSRKIDKIEFNQNLVRTYSGVLGLTYIISY